MQDIITVREFPMKESLRTSVNLLPLKGMWPWSLSKALIHSFNASKLLLISAPSNLVCLSLSVVSAPRSLPARSMKESLPTRRGGFDWFPSADFLIASWRIAWEREDSSFAPVVPVLLVALPLSISSTIASVSETLYSCKPTMHTCCLPSSLMHSFLLKGKEKFLFSFSYI